MYQKIWNEIHQKYYNGKVEVDNFLSFFREDIESVEGKILDLGSGTGNSSIYLDYLGKEVVALDFSKKALEILKKHVDVECICRDMLKKLPFEDESIELVVADLSIHYFSTVDTMSLIKDIGRILKKNGILIFRLNSTKDVNHGAGQGKLIEKNYYLVEGMKKRFFDLEDIDFFFCDFNMRYLSLQDMLRYEKLKKVWTGMYTK